MSSIKRNFNNKHTYIKGGEELRIQVNSLENTLDRVWDKVNEIDKRLSDDIREIKKTLEKFRVVLNNNL